MPKDFSRTRRVAEQMQRELAELIRREVKDPRVGWVTVAGVEVSKDLSYAKVYVSSLDQPERIDESIAVLQKAAGFLRRELGRRMVVRTIPELRFVYDASSERAQQLSSLIDRAVKEDRKHGSSDETD